MSILFGLSKGQGAGLNWSGYQSWISKLFCVEKKKLFVVMGHPGSSS